MIRSPEEISTMMDINQKLVDKAVKVIEKSGSWTGRVVGVIDHETFSVKKYKAAEPKSVSMFDIRSL